VPGTTYYVCAIGQNSVGTAWGAVASFVTPLPPLVTTGVISSLTNGGATLNGTGTPNRAATTGWFRYSTISPGTCNDTFGTRAPTAAGTAIPAGNSSVAYTETITGLVPGATYYYCAIAQNSVDKAWVAVASFVTPLPPLVTDEQALHSWEKELEAFVTPLMHKAGDVPVKQLVVEQVNIRETILEHVKQTRTDLVVVGTRGKNSLRHLLIGTTAEKIVQHAPCSILAVKPDDVVAAGGS
jgi:nucleotide-binding universal stress UspA family protein